MQAKFNWQSWLDIVNIRKRASWVGWNEVEKSIFKCTRKFICTLEIDDYWFFILLIGKRLLSLTSLSRKSNILFIFLLYIFKWLLLYLMKTDISRCRLSWKLKTIWNESNDLVENAQMPRLTQLIVTNFVVWHVFSKMQKHMILIEASMKPWANLSLIGSEWLYLSYFNRKDTCTDLVHKTALVC